MKCSHSVLLIRNRIFRATTCDTYATVGGKLIVLAMGSGSDAFQAFANGVLDILVEANPGVVVASLARIMREEWEKLSPEERQPYEVAVRRRRK